MSDQPKSPDPTNALHNEVEDRFGVLPNFFRLAPDTPEITENLWGFAKFGYLDNPLPSLFKERLFVFLSQFCEVRYCISRHVGFLGGLGRPSGDRHCSPESVEQIVRLIRRPFPKGEALEQQLAFCEACETPLAELPEAETPAEEAVFACTAHVFLQTADSARCLEGLRRALGGVAYQHLLVFITFIRTAHFWTKVHPELQQEEDIAELLDVHEALAACVLNAPEENDSETTQILLDELVELRKQRDEAELLRVTLASIGDAVIVTDSQGRITNVNAVAEELTGWSRDDAHGLPLETVFQIINEGTRLPVEDPATKALRIGEIVGLANHTILVAKTGAEIPIDDSAAPIRNRDGQVVGSVLVFRDITKRRQAEREMEDARQYAESIVETVRQPLVVVDGDLQIHSANRSFYQTFGLTVEETEGTRLYDLGNGQWNLPELRSLLEEVLTEDSTIEDFEVEYSLPDAGPRTMLLNACKLHRADDHTQMILLGIEDITERKQGQESMRRLAAVVESSDDAIISKTLDGIIRTWNAAAERIFGYSAEETVGQHISLLIPEERLDEEDRIIAQLRAGQRVEHFDTERQRSDGQIVQISLTISPIRDATGKVIGASKIARNIDERKRMEDELRRYAADLSEADRRKTEFLATLGHELRNPLAPIRTGLEAIKMLRGDPEKLTVICDTMERQVQQMVRLIDDLLDVSRITQGKLELRTCRVNLNDVVRAAIEAVQPLIDDARHELAVDLSAQPIHVDGDPNRLAQVLSNLLNNSTKYTPSGGHIRLTVERQDDKALITVMDDGLGIPLERQQDIFEMFTQIERSLEKSYSGLGIGLTLVKQLVEMHHGSIDVRSEGANQGSEFCIRLPILVESPATAIVSHQPVDNLPALRILVVDDNTAAATMLEMVVKMLGNEVRTAHDGQQAVEVASEFRPDVVLMDLGMPIMNGFEAARAIRKQSWGQTMLIIALTGWGQDEDRSHTKEAGFDHHLVKPAEPAALQQILAAHQSRLSQ